MRLTTLLCSLMLPLTAHVRAEEPISTVTVTASPDTTAQRRDESVATVVVGHAELVRQGDRTLSDALRRVPGVTVGAGKGQGQGSQLQLRGLGQGYTLVMLDGVPVQPGFSLDALDPELVERVEIRRAATAEFSTQAIAGAINIVLKKAGSKHQREFKLGASESAGRPSGSATLQWSDRQGGGAQALAATLSQSTSTMQFDEWQRDADLQGAPVLVRHTPQQEIVRSQGVELAPRLSWALAGEGSLAWQNLLSFRRQSNRHHGVETAELGENSAYPDNRSNFDQDSSVLRTDLQWLRKLDGGATLEVKAGAGRNHRRSDFMFIGRSRDGHLLATNLVDSGVDEVSAGSSGSYRRSLGEQHTLAAGWDGEWRRRSDFRREQQFDLGVTTLRSDEAYTGTVRRLALFAQDEWTFAPRWSAYLGLRWEQLRTVSGDDGAAQNQLAQVASQLWSPLLQLLWKRTEKDQLRLALTRTYKAPTLYQLIPRRYTINNGNSSTNPDTLGNPALRPERAWGLDAAYEFYPVKDAMLGVSGSLRRIDDVMLDRLYYQNGRWLATPSNQGGAQVRSLELEAKLPLSALLPTLLPTAPAIDLRANLARNWSRLDAVAGPDNRLASQLPWSANLGLDYRLARWPLTLGGNVNVQGGTRMRVSSALLETAGAARTLDIYGLWRFSDQLRLRVSGANLLARSRTESSAYTDDTGRMLRTVDTRGWRSWRLMLEGAL